MKFQSHWTFCDTEYHVGPETERGVSIVPQELTRNSHERDDSMDGSRTMTTSKRLAFLMAALVLGCSVVFGQETYITQTDSLRVARIIQQQADFSDSLARFYGTTIHTIIDFSTDRRVECFHFVYRGEALLVWCSIYYNNVVWESMLGASTDSYILPPPDTYSNQVKDKKVLRWFTSRRQEWIACDSIVPCVKQWGSEMFNKSSTGFFLMSFYYYAEKRTVGQTMESVSLCCRSYYNPKEFYLSKHRDILQRVRHIVKRR